MICSGFVSKVLEAETEEVSMVLFNVLIRFSKDTKSGFMPHHLISGGLFL